MTFSVKKFREQLDAISDNKEKIRAVHSLVWPNREPFPNTLVLSDGAHFIDEAFELAKAIDDKWGIATGHVNKGFIGLYVTQDIKTFENFQLGLSIFQEINDSKGYARTLSVMAYSLWMMGRYDEALDHALQCLKYVETQDELEPIGWSNYALGVFHYDLKDYATSEFYYRKALDIFKKDTNLILPCARCTSGLGSVMIALERYDEALEYILFSLEEYRKVENGMGEGRALNDIGVIYRIQENFLEAEKYLKESLELRDKANYYQGIVTTCFELGNLYFKISKNHIALQYLFRAAEVAEKTNAKPKLFQIHEMIGEVYKQTNELAKALEHKEKFFQIKTEIMGEQTTNKLKHMQTQFATEKSEKEAEIHRLKNVELRQAYLIIEEKNKNIVDSINYAKRIQQAILPSDAEIKKVLPESFVLYMPKDVVSGDFYWIEKKENKLLFAAVDCTGHGVPGAFMSMIGTTLLNEIVNDKGITTPGEILAHLREGVIKSLKQTGSEGENQDGMDIALCSIEGNKLEFAGANNPLWIFNKNGMQEIKADKQPIFTDGYADQIGGEKEKKFKYKQLQEVITNNYEKSMKEQQTVFSNIINHWKGSLEQVDDILLIGIRI
jgi:serine phosphatase RsbU (regulator of sigma subunit)